MKKLLVVQVAALGWDLVRRDQALVDEFGFRPVDGVFPALTCTAQATLRTGTPPSLHGMVSNGRFFPDLGKTMFWEQAAALVDGPRIWDAARERGQRVGMMFWQQSLGEGVDLVLSPKPVHKHSGGMILDCYSQPADLYETLIATVGRPFPLMNYWGPMAGRSSSAWIVAAVRAVMVDAALAPDILFAYVPHLDYDLQRHGPDSARATAALAEGCAFLRELRADADRSGYDVLFAGDYAIGPVSGCAVFPNRALRNAGLLNARAVKGRLYLDLFSSKAFAMVDHEVAHVYLLDPSGEAAVRSVLGDLSGVGEVLDRGRQEELAIAHATSGDLVVTAAPGHWFAYPWWTGDAQAPDFARHVDIHNKPGFDPCELFWGWPPMSVSRDTTRVRGSHGRVGPERRVAWSASWPVDPEPDSSCSLAAAIKARIDRAS